MNINYLTEHRRWGNLFHQTEYKKKIIIKPASYLNIDLVCVIIQVFFFFITSLFCGIFFLYD